jgi:predicted lipid-binding transport protein (Tim44 family)
MVMYGPGPGWMFGILSQIAMFLGGVLLTVAVIGVTILLVRYLIVATRAAQRYLDTHPAPAPAPAEPSPEAPPTAPTSAEAPAAKPAPRSRTPKTPPAAL